MPTYAKTGASFDTLTLYSRVFKDFADGDSLLFTYPSELLEMKTGKDGNTTYVENRTGDNLDLTLRLIIGSNDDLFLAAKLKSQKADLPGFVLAEGRISKRIGDDLGNAIFLIYDLKGGAFIKDVPGIFSSEGNTDSSISTYELRFALATRSGQ